MPFTQLDASRFGSVLPLVVDRPEDLTAIAVAEGSCPGEIWVDSPESPRTALLSTPEGHFLAGQRPVGETAEALRQLFAETIFPRGREWGWRTVHVGFPASDWREVVATAVDVPHPVWTQHHYFALRDLRRDWRVGWPEGFSLRRVDADLLARDELRNVEHLRGWGEGNFGSREAFLAWGFGFCALHLGEIACWCLSDCVSGDRCEMGIHTAETYRQRGLATRVVAATVEHCLNRGLTHIGWHCRSSNLASAATARAVGFEKTADLPAVEVWFNAVDSLFAHGNQCFVAAQYAEAAVWYERGFAELASGSAEAADARFAANRADRARRHYQAACAHSLSGDDAAARRHVEAALDLGTERWLLW